MRKVILSLFFIIFIVFTSANVTLAGADNDIDFEDLFDNHQSVMLIIHPQSGEIYYANQAAADFYGYSKEVLVSMNINEINTLSPEEVAVERQKAANEERNFFIFKHQLADGKIRTVHVYSYPVIINGETYLFSIIIDQTLLAATELRNRSLIIGIIGLVTLGIIVTSSLLFGLWRKNSSLKESEKRFKILHNASFGGIAIHDKGYILDCNQGLSDITGYSMIELVGMNGLLLIAPDYRDFVMDKIINGYEKPYEAFGIRKNGDIYPLKLEARNIPYDDKQVRVVEFRDITEAKAAEKALGEFDEKLKNSEEKFRLLTTEMQLGLALHEIITDKHGKPKDYRFIEVNASFETITGLKKEDIIGKTVLEVLPDTEQNWIKTYGQVALTGKPVQFEQYSKDIGKYFNVSAYSPKKGLFAVIVDDITNRKLKDDEILHISNHDYLTNLPNRRYFQEMLSKLDNKKYYPLGIVMMDMNALKLINDSYGHDVGNDALVLIAKGLRKNKKENQFIARVGGDEFAMLYPNTTTDLMEKCIEKIDVSISKLKVENIELSLALGYDIKRNVNESLRVSLNNAENNMYKDKVFTGKSDKNEAIQSILQTLQAKYYDEKVHSERVSRYCKEIGIAMNLRKDEVKELEMAGLYHDIGKISIPDAILDKPGKLTESEWNVMKTHTLNGYQILRAAVRYSNIAEYAMSHHERIDGKGYPNGLKGEDIKLFSKIICVADAYEAMTSDRPYRKAMKKEDAIKELKKHAGTQFDTEIVELFINKVIAT